MNLLLSLLYLFLCTEVTAFHNYPYSKIHKSILRINTSNERYTQTFIQSSIPRYTNIILRTSSDDNNDKFDVFNEELDETILRINFSYQHNSDEDDDKGSAALSAIQDYTRSFPCAAMLPVQPLTYVPVKIDTSASRHPRPYLPQKLDS